MKLTVIVEAARPVFGSWGFRSETEDHCESTAVEMELTHQRAGRLLQPGSERSAPTIINRPLSIQFPEELQDKVSGVSLVFRIITQDGCRLGKMKPGRFKCRCKIKVCR